MKMVRDGSNLITEHLAGKRRVELPKGKTNLHKRIKWYRKNTIKLIVNEQNSKYKDSKLINF